MTVRKSQEYVEESESENEGLFEVPKGFRRVENVKKRPLDASKELWLIKVPRDVSLKNLKKLPVSFTASSYENGPSSFEVDGVNYKAHEEFLSSGTDNRKYVVLGGSSDGQLRPLNTQITRFYNVSERVKIPDIDADAIATLRRNVKKVRLLRMRHFPTGYGSADYEEAKPLEDILSDDASRDELDDSERKTKKIRLDDSSKVEKKVKKEKMDKKEKKEKKEKKAKKEKKEKKDKKNKS